jgi:fimbrial isopeptide formation D2 family protein/LPXTG-motif cell wall-anchored protein
MAALMALAMTASLGTLALADPLPPDSGNLHIHKYIGSVTGDTANGTELSPDPGASAKAVNGVVFDIYKVDVEDGMPASGATYVLDGLTCKVYVSGSLTGTYTLTLADSVTTSGLGVGSSYGLDQGVYLVVENLAASTNVTDAVLGTPMYVSSVAASFLVAVPMTNPSGDGWLTDVHVYPKNEVLAIEKEVTSSGSVMVGDTVSYKITVSVPADIATAKRFAVIDVFDEALDFQAGSVTVRAVPYGLMDEGDDYTVSYDPGTRTLTVAFTTDGRANLDGSSSVEVCLDAKVNDKILDKGDSTVPNKATVEFTNADGIDFEAGTDEEDGGSQVHTASIEVSKVNQAGIGLTGAEFKVATSEANAQAGRFLRIDPVSHVIYDYNTTEWAALGEANDYCIAPNHTATFEGLRDYVDGEGFQTYYVVEVKAPSGYNMLAGPVVLTFDGSEADHVISTEVVNSQGFILPQTGGMGTVAYTVAGIILLGLAVILAMRLQVKGRSAR